MLELIRSFLKTKRLGRGAWNLVRVKVGAVFCLVSKQWEKKKRKPENYNHGKTQVRTTL